MLTLEEERELMATAKDALDLADGCLKAIVVDRKKSLPVQNIETCLDLSHIWGRITQALGAIKNNESVTPLTKEQVRELRRVARRGTKGLQEKTGVWRTFRVLQHHGFILTKHPEVGRKQHRRYITKHYITGRGKAYLRALK